VNAYEFVCRRPGNVSPDLSSTNHHNAPSHDALNVQEAGSRSEKSSPDVNEYAVASAARSYSHVIFTGPFEY
jgi:hypothetical protein